MPLLGPTCLLDSETKWYLLEEKNLNLCDRNFFNLFRVLFHLLSGNFRYKIQWEIRINLDFWMQFAKFLKNWNLKIHSTYLFGPTCLFFFNKNSSLHIYSDYTFIRNGKVYDKTTNLGLSINRDYSNFVNIKCTNNEFFLYRVTTK